ncbi:MAG: hypothetical protein GC160_15890 [Acidobacteria bacterium]|nr:hypothetical protein [Acidobacteriota bacterium]
MLWIGPPGSGKTTLCLERLQTALRQGRAAEVRLVTPTASMAQHLLHELARRGLTVPGDLILSLDELLGRLVPEAKTPSAAEADWLLDRAVEQGAADFFGALARTNGIRRRLAQTVQELQTARCDPERFAGLAEDARGRAVAAVYKLYEAFVRSWGLVSPAERLTLAAQKVAIEGPGAIRQIDFDGFVHLSPGERDLMQSLAVGGADVLVTLLEEPPAGSFPRMERRRLAEVRRPRVTPEVVCAVGVEQEVEEIARRILELRRRTNRPFHSFGVLLRSTELYQATIRTVFEGLGIPYRLRRPQPLSAHAVGRFALELLRAAAEGFPGEPTLDALRMTPCKVAGGESDRWDFAVRGRLPCEGLESLRADAPQPVVEALDGLESAADWRTERATAREWRARCEKTVRALLRRPAAPDGLAPEAVLELRAHAEAVRRLVAALEEAKALLERGGVEKIRLSRFLDVFERVLELTDLPVSDSRRDVVNVINLYEARQWELPYVFAPGLVEGWFPKAVQEDLLLPDAQRKKLRRVGVEVRTRAEAVAEEEFLYRIAVTRATESLVLSRPAADAGGAPLLRSFLLPPEAGSDRPAVGGKALRPAAAPAPPCAEIVDPRLRQWIGDNHQTFSPSGVDRYLQCPYLFFGDRTLRLQGPPQKASERLDPLWKGSIIHEVVARWSASGHAPIEAILTEIFDAKLAEADVPPSFHTELLKAMMARDLERFAAQPGARSVEAGAAHESDIRYVVDLGEGASYEIKGRIDRYEVLEGEAAVVIDYKYSRADRINKLRAQHEKGDAVQLLLYLRGLALQGLKPGGALLWALRKDAALAGWAVESLYERFDLGKQVSRQTPEQLAGLLEQAERTTAEAVRAIRAGRIEAAPLDRDYCGRFCDYRSLCRVQL